MAHPDVVQAIEAHVRASWPHTPVFAEEDDTQTPADGGPFLVVTFPWSRSEQTEVGEMDDGTFEEEGAVNLTLAVPRGAGLVAARAQMEALAGTFRARHIGPAWCAAPQSAAVDDDRSDAAYVRLMMAVPYRFNLSG